MQACSQSQCSVTTCRDGVGTEVGGGFRIEGTHVCLWPIHIDVWQKLSQYCNYPPIKKKKNIKRAFQIVLSFKMHMMWICLWVWKKRVLKDTFFFENLNFLYILFIYWLCCPWTFSSCGVGGSYCKGFSYCRAQALECTGLSCGTQAEFLCSMWNLPWLGIEPMFPVLAGRLSTTGPPGKF